MRNCFEKGMYLAGRLTRESHTGQKKEHSLWQKSGTIDQLHHSHETVLLRGSVNIEDCKLGLFWTHLMQENCRIQHRRQESLYVQSETKGLAPISWMCKKKKNNTQFFLTAVWSQKSCRWTQEYGWKAYQHYNCWMAFC